MPGRCTIAVRQCLRLLALSLLTAALPAQEPPTPPPPPPAPQPQDANPPPPAPAPGLAETQVDWIASFPEALRIARDSKKPLFVAFNMDHEVANDALADTTYHDKKFVERSRAFVCVICSIFKHEEAVGDGGVATCKRFGGVSCADHRQCEIRASDALIGTEEVVAPQHVLVTADGRVLARRAYTLPLADLLKMMDQSLRLAGAPGAPAPPDPKVERARIDELLHEAEKASRWRKDEFVKQIVDLGTAQSRDVLLEYLGKRGADDETRAEILGQIAKSGDYLVLEALRKATKDSKTWVALTAVDSLGKIRLPEAKEDLKKLLSSYRGNDYGRVLRALAACARDDKVVLELVLKQAKGSDQNVRVHAIIALRFFSERPEIDDFLKKALDDRITGARACAAWAVGMGRFQNCRKELEHLATVETVQDLKEIALAAVSHLDHDPADTSCCGLEGMIYTYVTLGDPRR